MANKKILITPQGMLSLGKSVYKIFGNGYDLDITGGQIESRDELLNRLNDKHGSVIGAEPIDEEIMSQCPQLSILSRFGEGYDSINIEDANKYNIKVAVSRGVNTKAVARHTLALLFALTNNITKNYLSVRANKWERHYNYSPEGKTLGLVGLGPIGYEFAKLASPLGYRIAYYSRKQKVRADELDYKYYGNIDSLINESNIVSIHIKSTKDTINIINQERINNMSNKYFINTARGNLVDEDALYLALKSGKIEAAALDVFRNEPAKEISLKLQCLTNVVATCHTAGYDLHSVTQAGKRSIQNIVNHFSKNYANVDSYIN